VRGIEVVKGSGNILFGPRTVGGVINFLTLTPPPGPHAVVDVEGGNYGYSRGIVQYGDTMGPVRYVVQAMHRQGDGFRHDPFDTTDVFGKVAFDTSDKGEATIKLGFHDDEAVSPDVGLTRAQFATDPRRPSLAPYDEATMRRYEASLIHEQRFTPETKLRTLLYAYTNTRLWRRQDFDRDPVPGVDYQRIVGDPSIPKSAIWFRDTDTVQNWLFEVAGAEPPLETRFLTGDVAHTLDAGGRLLGETAHYAQSTGERPTSYDGALQGVEQHRTIALAGYLQDRMAMRDDLLLTPGVRVEHASFHQLITRQADATGPHDVFLPGDKDVTGVIPGIGTVYGTKEANAFVP
jgi:Fe(3+) dicitrate transport protein